MMIVAVFLLSLQDSAKATTVAVYASSSNITSWSMVTDGTLNTNLVLPSNPGTAYFGLNVSEPVGYLNLVDTVTFFYRLNNTLTSQVTMTRLEISDPNWNVIAISPPNLYVAGEIGIQPFQTILARTDITTGGYGTGVGASGIATLDMVASYKGTTQYQTQGSITWGAIPEPSTSWFVLLSSAFLARRRR